MARPKNYVLSEDNLVEDLNRLADFVIGNERPEDASFNSRTTLPEIIAYAMIYPESELAVKAAVKKVHELSSIVDKLQKKLALLHQKIEIKKPKY
jgi:hypothetical protein